VGKQKERGGAWGSRDHCIIFGGLFNTGSEKEKKEEAGPGRRVAGGRRRKKKFFWRQDSEKKSRWNIRKVKERKIQCLQKKKKKKNSLGNERVVDVGKGWGNWRLFSKGQGREGSIEGELALGTGGLDGQNERGKGRAFGVWKTKSPQKTQTQSGADQM